MKINPGKVKLWADIGHWYYSKVIQTITVVGVLKLAGLSWWKLLVGGIAGLPLLLLLIYFHMKYIYPKEHEYSWQKNPMVKDLISKIERREEKEK